MWTLIEGIKFANELEEKIKRHYKHYHVAIGGSTLHKGLSAKDLDIFIYPHKTGQCDRKYLDNALIEFGLSIKRLCTPAHKQYGDDKEVIEYVYNGKRVDIFFLS